MILQMAIVVTTLIVGGWLLWRWNARKTRVTIDATPPASFPSGGFSHTVFEELLREFSIAGKIDYERWHDDPDAVGRLDSYLAAVGRFGPTTSPERFTGDHDVLAYWMYAYNAFVIKAVLERWPLESVTDVKAPIELVKGLGFFYTLHLLADGRWRTLYAIEHDMVLGQREDPRVHFVLNCGSEACPVIRPSLPTGGALEVFLADAAREFAADPRNVEIEHDSKTVRLSAIFKWYEREFVAHLIRSGMPSDRGVIDYVTAVAPPELAAQLSDISGYRVEYREYDWSLNAAGSAG